MVVCQAVLACVFGAAGILKLMAGPGATYPMLTGIGLSYETALAVARVLPFVELALAVALVSGWRSAAVARLCLGFLVAFTTVIIVAGVRSNWGASCGCLGALSEPLIVPSA